MAEITKQQYEELQEKYERLRLNEEIYRVAIGLTDHSITVVDIPNRTLNQIYNEGDWTGVAVSMPDAPESIIATGIIHPSDCEGYREFYRKIYSGVPKGEYTMRTMEQNRGWVWFTMYYQTVFDENGKPLRAICFSDDITVKKKAEEKYQQYRIAVTADADFVWEANLTEDVILAMDQRQNKIFDESGFGTYTELSESAINNVPDSLQQDVIREVFGRDQLLEAFARGRREVTVEHQLDYGDGRGPRWLRTTAYLMTNNVEDVTVIICSRDHTNQHRELEELEMKAERDALTGIYNRASFERGSEQLLEAYPNRIHGLMMIDVDDFKNYNDTYGHAFGDTVLQMIANVMQKTFRVGDLLGRFGGDEFVVFMRDAGDAAAIVARAQDLQRELLETCRLREMPLNVTISIGVALSREDDDFKALYLRADEAMYRGKKDGKNCINISAVSKVWS